MNEKPVRVWTWVNRLFKLSVVVLVVGAGLVLVGGYDLPGFSPVLDPDHSASPAVEGADKIHLETDTLHVTVNNNSDYRYLYVIAPDGVSYRFFSSRVHRTEQWENRPNGWPAGNYTVQDVGRDGTVYNNDTVYLEPEE